MQNRSDLEARGYKIVERPEAIYLIDFVKNETPPHRIFREKVDFISWEDAGDRPSRQDVTKYVREAGEQTPAVIMTDVGYPSNQPTRIIGSSLLKIIGLGAVYMAFRKKEEKILSEDNSPRINRRDFIRGAPFTIGIGAISLSEFVWPFSRFIPSRRTREFASLVDFINNPSYSIDGRSAINIDRYIQLAPLLRSRLNLPRKPVYGISFGEKHKEGKEVGFVELLESDDKRRDVLDKHASCIRPLSSVSYPVLYTFDKVSGQYKPEVFFIEPATGRITQEYKAGK